MNNNMIEKDEREKRIDSIRMALAGGIGILFMALAIIYKINGSYNKSALIIDISVFILVLLSTVISYAKLRITENKKLDFNHKIFSLRFDERENRLLIQALSFSAVLIFLLLASSIILKLLIFDFVSFARIDIGILVLMSLVMHIYSFFAKDYMVPKINRFKNSSRKKNLTEKESRVVSYINKAVRFSILFTLFDKYYLKSGLISYTGNGSNFWSFIKNALLNFILYFILNYLWSEYSVKKMKRFLDNLENE